MPRPRAGQGEGCQEGPSSSTPLMPLAAPVAATPMRGACCDAPPARLDLEGGKLGRRRHGLPARRRCQLDTKLHTDSDRLFHLNMQGIPSVGPRCETSVTACRARLSSRGFDGQTVLVSRNQDPGQQGHESLGCAKQAPDQ
jgi:hypothetical protein